MAPSPHDSSSTPSIQQRPYALIGIKHAAKAAAGLPVSTAWIEMPPEDVEQLIKTLQETLAELGKE